MDIYFFFRRLSIQIDPVIYLHYTVKNGVYGNPVLGCPGNTGCTTPHGVFPFHLEEVFSYTPVHPLLYQTGCCGTPMSKFYYTPIRAHNAPNMVLLILYQWGVVILP